MNHYYDYYYFCVCTLKLMKKITPIKTLGPDWTVMMNAYSCVVRGLDQGRN